MTQIEKWEEIQCDLAGAKAVCGFLREYFESPEENQEAQKREMFQDLYWVLNRLITDIVTSVDDVTQEAYQRHRTR